MIRSTAALMATALFLTACGSTSEERGISGAGLGAAGGAMIGALTGLSVLEGAIIGTAVGGATGLLTDEKTLNLGDPIWKKKSSQSSSGETTSTSALPGDEQTVRIIQSRLTTLGYGSGPADGKLGPRTREAIRLYQRDHGLLVDGNPSPELASHMEQRIAGSRK